MRSDTIPANVPYAERLPIKVPAWHGLVAWDMLCNGLTTGLFLVMALGELSVPEVFTPLAKFAYPIALAFLLIDLVLLVLDLGDPWRFHHMLRVVKLGSPMSVGVWSLTAYSLPLTIVALLSLLPDDYRLEEIRKIVLVLGILPALLSAAYKGVLLSTSAQPGWKDARWLGAQLTTGAIGLGCAELIALACAFGEPRMLMALRGPFLAVLAMHSVTTVLLLRELRPALRRAFPQPRPFLIVLGTSCAILLPIGLASAGSGTALLLTSATLVVAGNFVSRILLIQLPHRA